MEIDLSLKNAELYKGCLIEEVAGRLNLATPVDQAISIVGKNIHEIVAKIPREQRNQIVLTGPMAVWAYLIVFHAVVHSFGKVFYADGRGEYLISKHGV